MATCCGHLRCHQHYSRLGRFLDDGPAFTFIRKWGWFERKIWPILEKTQTKIHPYVEKYGEFGVAVFIGIPLPGSGVYTGAFGSYLLGLDKRKFAIANVIGVVIAAVAVTALCLLIDKGVLGEGSWFSEHAGWFMEAPLGNI